MAPKRRVPSKAISLPRLIDVPPRPGTTPVTTPETSSEESERSYHEGLDALIEAAELLDDHDIEGLIVDIPDADAERTFIHHQPSAPTVVCRPQGVRYPAPTGVTASVMIDPLHTDIFQYGHDWVARHFGPGTPHLVLPDSLRDFQAHLIAHVPGRPYPVMFVYLIAEPSTTHTTKNK